MSFHATRVDAPVALQPGEWALGATTGKSAVVFFACPICANTYEHETTSNTLHVSCPADRCAFQDEVVVLDGVEEEPGAQHEVKAMDAVGMLDGSPPPAPNGNGNRAIPRVKVR